MKTRNKILYSLLLSCSFLYAEIGIESPEEHTESPLLFDDNTTTAEFGVFSSGNDGQATENLVSDDNLPDNNISTGIYSQVRMGDKIWYKKYDESGNVYLEDKDGNIYDVNNDTMTDAQKEELKSLEDEYNALARDTYLADQNLTDEEKTKNMIESNMASYELKKKNLALANRTGESLNERVGKYAGNATSKGGQNALAIFTSDTKGLEYKKDNNMSLTDAELEEINSTKFYREHLTSSPEWNRNELMKSDTEVVLSNAYQDLSAIKSELLGRLKGGIIQCQLSRNLIPSYMCPMAGKTEIRFPTTAGDSRKVDLQEALDDCNDYCISEPGYYPTVSFNVLNDKNFNVDFSEHELYPNYVLDENKIILDNDDRMPLDYVQFDISVPKPADSNLTDEEWNLKLTSEYKPAMKFTLTAVTLYWDKAGEAHETVNRIYDNYVVYLNKDQFTLKLPIGDPAIRYELTIKKPFFFKRTTGAEFANDGGKIIINDIKSEYTSTDYHYCVIKQFVPYPNFCFGGMKNVEYMNINGQDMYLCKDKRHKIGPEITTGAFYKETSAKDACRIRMACKPTYTHYNPSTTGSDLIYESKIVCVDSPENTACSDELCEALFLDQNQTILNEAILGLSKEDVDWKYTIQNGARTDIVRPKINFSEVSTTTTLADSSNTNYDEVFRNEEKDSAYIYMVDNLTYNRVKYRIGDESPARVAYVRYGDLSHKGLGAMLKPASFDYTNPNEFYVYAVSATDHIFYPVAGSWFINGNLISVTEVQKEETVSSVDGTSTSQVVDDNATIEPPKFMDRTYAVKTGPNWEDWEVFRRIQNYRYYMLSYEDVPYTDPDTGTTTLMTTMKYEWVELPAYKVDKFEKYDSNSGKFLSFSTSEEAPYFDTVKFDSAKNFYNFDITSNLDMTRVKTPGLLIHDQEKINNNTSYQRLYNVEYKGGHDSNLMTTNYWLVYSDHKLTYDELEQEIEGSDYRTAPISPSQSKWSLYDMVNNAQYHDIIEDDGEINNGIRVFKKGTPDNLTFSVAWIPSPKEKGKKVFKFAFLFSDIEIENFDFQ